MEALLVFRDDALSMSGLLKAIPYRDATGMGSIHIMDGSAVAPYCCVLDQ